MDFKKLSVKSIIILSLLTVLIIAVILWKVIYRTDSSIPEGVETLPASQIGPDKDTSVKSVTQNQPLDGTLTRESELDTSKENDTTLQEQLDSDRQQQKQTKYLKMKLEQTNLELEQEKALAEINKLKMDNMGAFKETTVDGKNSFPEIKVEYIGGDSVKKEAILSIAGVNFQVKEKTSPTDSIQVMSISDSSVTLHFSAPQDLTKTIEYKPE